MIAFTCPACSRTLRVPDEQGGKKARCPSCAAISPIPMPATEHFAAVATVPPRTVTASFEQETTAPASAAVEPSVPFVFSLFSPLFTFRHDSVPSRCSNRVPFVEVSRGRKAD
jgi:hypothetical protein